MIEIRNVSKSFGPLKVLDDVSLTVAEGEVVAVIGPSGSGKSTLLRCINYLESFDDGTIMIAEKPIGHTMKDGRRVAASSGDIYRMRAEIGMVFQSFNLFPHMTVLENVMEGLVIVRRAPRAHAEQAAQSLLRKVGLADKLTAYPKHLSGGQQQRVAIARALAMGPKIMLYDEPTSALDPELVGEVLDVIKTLTREGMTTVIVTHEMKFAEEVANRVVFMDRGAILEIGAPDRVFHAPNHDRARQFLSRVLRRGT